MIQICVSMHIVLGYISLKTSLMGSNTIMLVTLVHINLDIETGQTSWRYVVYKSVAVRLTSLIL